MLRRFYPVEQERLGRIVLLNGASSSGKSSIGQALLGLLPDPWFLFPVDALGAMRSTEHTRVLAPDEVDAMLRRTRLGYHRAVAAVASVGNDVIMDYPLTEPWRLDDLLDVLEGYDVTLVDVRCSPGELDRRERARGDRPVGLARSQAPFQHGIATSRSTPQPSARSRAQKPSSPSSPCWDRREHSTGSVAADRERPQVSRRVTARPDHACTPPTVVARRGVGLGGQ